jgi:uncharacterized membrane protein
MRRGILVDTVLGVLGILVFIYGDLVMNRDVRLVGGVIVTVCVVAAAILSGLRGDDS